MESRGPVFSVKALTIVCTDMERSTLFYRDILGADVIAKDWGMSGWFQLGSLVINLLPSDTKRRPAEFPTDPMPLLWLEVADLAAAAAWIAQHEVEVIDPGDGEMPMIVADPDGFVIEVWQAEPPD